MKLINATNEKHYTAAINLFKEYAAWLKIDLCFQKFDEELASIKEMYAAPLGTILLLQNEKKFIGCVAVRNKGEQIAELKRMYIQADFRKKGAGKLLLQNALEFAFKAGYKKIRLDTLATMTPAINLYMHFGFYEIPAYYHNPESNALFFEKDL